MLLFDWNVNNMQKNVTTILYMSSGKAMDSTMKQYLRLVFKIIPIYDLFKKLLYSNMILKPFSSQRHKINTFDEKPSAASKMQLYINDLKNQIEFSRKFFEYKGFVEPIT